MLLHEVLQKCTNQNIFIVEMRHVLGMLYDDDRKVISLEDELKIIEDAGNHVKKMYPHF